MILAIWGSLFRNLFTESNLIRTFIALNLYYMTDSTAQESTNLFTRVLVT